MKIIDLLVKISKGEKMSKKIKYKGYVWEYDKVAKDYYRNEIDEEYIYLFQELFKKETGFFINNEVKTIEEDKKLEKIKSNGNEFYSDILDIWIRKDKADAYCEFLMNKVNDLIEEVNKLKGTKQNESMD